MWVGVLTLCVLVLSLPLLSGDICLQRCVGDWGPLHLVSPLLFIVVVVVGNSLLRWCWSAPYLNSNDWRTGTVAGPPAKETEEKEEAGRDTYDDEEDDDADIETDPIAAAFGRVPAPPGRGLPPWPWAYEEPTGSRSAPCGRADRECKRLPA